MSTGIDYGMGQTNIDHETGIRYSIISQHSLRPQVLEDFTPNYGYPICPRCGNDATEYDDDLHEEYEDRNGCADFACDSCSIIFDASEAYGDEPVSHNYEDSEYTGFLDNTGDVWCLQSPYFTYAQFCSPCAPGACHLNHPVEDGAKCYCWDKSWFEENHAPYPVYRVSDGTLVEP